MDRDFFKRGMRSISTPANTGGSDGVPADIQFNHPTALGYYSERGDFFAWTGTKTREAFENNHYTFDADGTMRPFDYGLGLIDDPNPLISERAAGRYTF